MYRVPGNEFSGFRVRGKGCRVRAQGEIGVVRDYGVPLEDEGSVHFLLRSWESTPHPKP